MEITEQVLKTRIWQKILGIWFPKSAGPMRFTPASSPCMTCLSLSVKTTLQISWFCLTSPGKPFPTQLDPLLLGSMVLNVTLTAMQYFGGPQTRLSDWQLASAF